MWHFWYNVWVSFMLNTRVLKKITKKTVAVGFHSLLEMDTRNG